MSEWNDTDRNNIASSLRRIAEGHDFGGLSKTYLQDLALAIDNV